MAQKKICHIPLCQPCFKNASARQFEEARNYFGKASEKAEIWVPEIFAEEAKPVLVELKLPLRKLSE